MKICTAGFVALLICLPVMAQNSRIKVHLIVGSEDHNAVTEKLGSDLREQMLASRKYVFVNERKEADVWIEVIGVGENGGLYAAASELLVW